MGALFVHDWDGYVFEQSVRDFWDGYSPYTVAEEAPFYTFLNVQDPHPQWYAYPPLPLLAMSVTFLPEHFLDLPPLAERVLLKAPMILGTLFLAVGAGLWTRQLGKTEATRIRVERLLLFNPFVILVGPMWGMTDPALVALFLFGALKFEQGRPYQAGVYFALSALIKPFPILLALPLVAYYVHSRGWKSVGRVIAAGLPVGAAVCLPFLLTNPDSFLNQVIGVHLQRQPQGLTIWSVTGLNQLSPQVVGAASITLVSVALLLLSFIAPRLEGKTAPLVLLLASSVQLLFWNRVVNEQYLILVVAPLLLLHGAGVLEDRLSRVAARAAPLLFGAITILQGFHFLTFVPPDVALRTFHKPVDVVAYETRQFFNWGFENPFPDYTPAIFVSLVLLVIAAVSIRHLARSLRPRGLEAFRTVLPSGTTVSAFGCLAIVLLGFTPLVTPAPLAAAQEPVMQPTDQPLVGAFYYLWWNNAAHDPGTKYGNWLEASQFPELGYYTNTRGVIRAHAQMMRENGIDVAIVSYHSEEKERYAVFQEEAARRGLLVAPLMELNQIYDRLENKPLNWSQQPVNYASYRLTNATRTAITQFVLELEPLLKSPASYRVHGRPVIFFYDSYVSAVGYGADEKKALASALLGLGRTTPQLRTYFNDSKLEPRVDDVLRHFPPLYNRSFYLGDKTPVRVGNTSYTVNQSALWRQAHLELHKQFWNDLRGALEERLGPVFLVSGDAFNDRAGFEAGIIKSLEDLEVFDGSFIYSPSFTWGVQPRDNSTFEQNFRLWEDRNLWLTSFANGLQRFSAFGVAPSYDDTVNRRATGFVIPAEHDNVFTYDRSWDSTLANPPSLVVLATFNEFFEGSSVEPDQKYGAKFLNETLAYRTRLADRLQATQNEPPVVVLAHERASRLNPRYSEMDNPHWWGLRLISAAARTYPGSTTLAVDGLEPTVRPDIAVPRMVLVDGGRDDYDDASLSQSVLQRIGQWDNDSVPTIFVGRELAPKLRDHVPADCQQHAQVVPDAHRPGLIQEELVDGDRLLAGHGAESGAVFLQRGGQLWRVGERCASHPNVAFVTVKPWGPTHSWEATAQTDPACLQVLVTAFYPNLLPDPARPMTECTARAP